MPATGGGSTRRPGPERGRGGVADPPCIPHGDLVPHEEEEEDRAVFPILSAAIGTDDATAALHGTHAEIFHLIRLFGRIVDETGENGPAPADRTDLRRALYGLDAILRLHMAQEEELYASIDADTAGALTPQPA